VGSYHRCRRNVGELPPPLRGRVGERGSHGQCRCGHPLPNPPPQGGREQGALAVCSDSTVKQPRRDDRHAVIASASEAIHAAAEERVDCFVAMLPCANASRLSQAMTSRYASAFSRRDAPELCWDQPRRRGRGEGRVLAAPMGPVQKKHGGRTTGSAKSSGLPRAMVLTVSFALSLVTGLSCHHRQ
jgi:hypothetical protein